MPPSNNYAKLVAEERQPLLAGQRQVSQDSIQRYDEPLTAPDTNDAEDDGEAAEEPEDVPLAEEPSTSKLLVIMVSMWIGVTMNALGMASLTPLRLFSQETKLIVETDTTIVATLSSPISSSFNSFSLVSWLATAYLISNAALQPLTGRLTDIFSRRTGFIVSALFFAAGNLVCGLAKSQGAIIAGRVIAGMGGGGINTISTFVASDLIPLRRRGLWQGIGNLFYGLGSGLGGVFGGFISDTIGWRWAFLIQVPVILLSAVLVFFTVHIPVKETDTSKIRRVDFLGAIALVLSMVLLLLGLNSGGNVVPWSHPLVYVSLPLAFVALVSFWYIEDKVAVEPMIPVRLLLDRTVGAACLTNWFATMATYTLIYYAPIYFQVLGASSFQAGERLIPSAVGSSLGSIGSGLIMKRTGRYWWLSFYTQLVFIASAVLIAATMDGHIAAWPPFIYFFMNGVGYASMLTITLIALIGAVDHEEQAVITSASYAFRSTGSTIGITIASAVFQNVVKDQLWKRFGGWKHADRIIPLVRNNIEEIKNLPPEWKEGVIGVFMDALRGVWVTMLGLTVLGAVCSLFMREHKLHSTLDRK